MNEEILGVINYEQSRQLFESVQKLLKPPDEIISFLEFMPEALMKAILNVDNTEGKEILCKMNGFMTIPCQSLQSTIINQKVAKCNRELISYNLVEVETQEYEADFVEQQELRSLVDYFYTNEELANYNAKREEVKGDYIDPGRDNTKFPNYYSKSTSNYRKSAKIVLQKYELSSNTNIYEEYTYRQHSINGLLVKDLGLKFCEEDSYSQENNSTYLDLVEPPTKETEKRRTKKSFEEEGNVEQYTYFIENPGHFYHCKLSYLQMITQLLWQCKNILDFVFKQKELKFLELDDNFIITYKYSLNTKEIKKSRIGHSINLVLELCQMLKKIHGIICNEESNIINVSESSYLIQQLFKEIANNQAFYRFKFKLMKEIKGMAAIRELSIENFSLYYFTLEQIFRSLNGILSDYLKNYTKRLLQQQPEKLGKSISKQRRLESIDEYFEEKAGTLVLFYLDAWKLWKSTFHQYFNAELTDDENFLINSWVEQKWEFIKEECLLIRDNIYFGKRQYKYKDIKENFNEYCTLLIQRLLCNDLQLKDSFYQKEEYYAELFSFCKELNLQFISLSDLFEENIEQFSSIKYLEIVSQNKIENKFAQELFELQQNNFTLFFQKLIETLKNYKASHVEIEFYDYFEYVDIRFKDSAIYILLDEIVIQIIMSKWPGLFTEEISISKSYSYFEFTNTYEELLRTNSRLQIVEQDLSFTYELSLEFIKKALSLYLDGYLCNYIYNRFSVTFVYKEHNFQLKEEFFTSFPLSFVIIQLIRYSENQWYVHNNYAQLLVKGRSFIKYTEYYKSEFMNINYFLSDRELDSGYLNIENDSHIDNEEHEVFDYLMPFSYDKHKFITQLTDILNEQNKDTVLEVLFNKLLPQRNIISFHVNELRLLQYTKNIFENDYYPCNHIYMLESELLALHLHRESQFVSVIEKFNKIILCQLSYYKETGSEYIEYLRKEEEKIIGVIEQEIRSNDCKRYPFAMFILPESHGGLGMFNFQEHYPQFTDYVLDFKDLEYNQSELKVQSEFEYCYLPLLENILKASRFSCIDEYFQSIIKQCYDREFLLENTLFRFSQQVYQQEEPPPNVLFSNMDDQQPEEKVLLTKAEIRGYKLIANRRFISFWSPAINRSTVFVGKQERIEETGITIKGKLITLCQFYENLFFGNLWSKIHNDIINTIKKALEKQNLYKNVEKLQSSEEKICNVYNSPKNEYGYADLKCTLLNEQAYGDTYLVNVVLIFCNRDEYNQDEFAEFAKNYIAENELETINIIIDLCYCRITHFSDPSLEHIAKSMTLSLKQEIEDIETIKLLRRRASELLEISQYQYIENTCFLTFDSIGDLFKQNNYYLHGNEKELLVFDFYNGTCNKFMSELKNDAIEQLLYEVNSKEHDNYIFYTEDTILKSKVENSIVEYSDKTISVYESLLELKICQFADMAQFNVKIELYQRDEKYGSLVEEFWRLIYINNILEDDKKSIRYIEACRELDYLFHFPKQKLEISLNKFDEVMERTLLEKFCCNLTELKPLCIGAQIERKAEALFYKENNELIANSIELLQIDKKAPHAERINALENATTKGEQIVVMPVNITEFYDLENLDYELCGIAEGNVIECRFLVKKFIGGFSLLKIATFGEEIEINEGRIQSKQFTAILTSKFEISVLEQVGVEMRSDLTFLE